MGKELMSGPSKITEALVALVLPPASREEVLGDLHESYTSPLQYFRDALATIPFVIAGRVRRTTDGQVLLMQSFALYASFLAGAWLDDAAFLRAELGLLRLAFPAGVALLVLVFVDAYSVPHSAIRGPVVALGCALVSQGAISFAEPQFAIPRFTALYGFVMSLLLCSAIRLAFPPRGSSKPSAR